MIKLKRVYERPDADDGMRILVDRLWPRGVTKADAHIDRWLKDVAPSPALRTWFGHDPARWNEFRKKYFAELKAGADAVAELRALAEAEPLTFVYAAKDQRHTHALVLKDFVERAAPRKAVAKSVVAKRAPAKSKPTKRSRSTRPKAAPRRQR
jgi:uncharacterized protein YeaO (DUF488 family)